MDIRIGKKREMYLKHQDVFKFIKMPLSGIMEVRDEIIFILYIHSY